MEPQHAQDQHDSGGPADAARSGLVLELAVRVIGLVLLGVLVLVAAALARLAGAA